MKFSKTILGKSELFLKATLCGAFFFHLVCLPLCMLWYERCIWSIQTVLLYSLCIGIQITRTRHAELACGPKSWFPSVSLFFPIRNPHHQLSIYYTVHKQIWHCCCAERAFSKQLRSHHKSYQKFHIAAISQTFLLHFKPAFPCSSQALGYYINGQTGCILV